METKIRYFGMIGEKLGKNEEIVSLPENTTNVRKFILSLYPLLESMAFTIAINQDIGDTLPEGKNVSEIAIFPPFAGG